MALPVKLLAAIGTTAGAVSAVVFITSTSRDADSKLADRGSATLSAASSASAPLDPWAELCVTAHDDDSREPREPASSCPGAQTQPSPGAPGDAGEGDSSEGGGSCESCGPLDDPFRDPWLIGSETAAAEQPGKPPPADTSLGALEDRIRELENSAYFEVVDEKTGRVMFNIGPNGARFFSSSGARVAAIGTTELGGYFAGRSPAGHEATIGARFLDRFGKNSHFATARREMRFEPGNYPEHRRFAAA